MQDQNFDQLSQQFQKQIYDTIKGQIRLALLQEDFQQAGPDLSQPGLKVLDAGGGIGQFSATLAARGHQVTLCDLSEEMLKLAREEFARTAPGAEAQFIHGPLQVLSEEHLGQFDLLLFHAVMEWLVDPFEALQRLLPLVKPGGFFSVMFYNKHALRWRYLSSAQFGEGMGDTFRRREGSLTPLARWNHSRCMTGYRPWVWKCGRGPAFVASTIIFPVSFAPGLPLNRYYLPSSSLPGCLPTGIWVAMYTCCATGHCE
ncbi:methyltransferase domain-containing protein [Pokkaliibacter sp. MBI-7]|uniref:methyltransferase n=1 Tax=Pokkaliibacter sp. MBI-7 TaxID=3040600 RepID=UPI002447A8B4|nr:methyltransferase [Pokkaliibacter sp. MBI-7]MDH2433099.1 methyltransferase domain-containing protein [Pokkaliibacter sp. MBI-7]